MNLRILLLFFILAATTSARAAWDVGSSLEDYTWQEFSTGSPNNPKEHGIRSALFANWVQEHDQGVMFAWRAKLYGGAVKYDTFVMCNCPSNNTPVSTTTDYSGVSNEGLVVFRENLGENKLDYVVGLGLDAWRRSINSGNQIEDYSILFTKFGLRVTKSRHDAGFHEEFGFKFPLWTRENAHLTSSISSQGFIYTSNPSISPKGDFSGYAELGYRINARFDLLGYYDSWRFKRSNNVMSTDTMGNTDVIWQPKSNMDALGIKLLVSF